MLQLSNRVNNLSESITIAVTSLAKKLKSEGKDILSFSAGEPDFGTPEKIKKSAIEALDQEFTKYTAVDGIVELKQAIQDKLKRDNNLDYSLNNIIVSNGAKHSLFNIFQSILENDDEVIIPMPYWVTYPEVVKYCGGSVSEILTTEETGFKITPHQLKEAITEKTKAIILTTPSNPTGSIYSKEELLALGEVLKDTNILVISDEMYEKLTYEGEFTSVASVSEDMFNRTITVNGLSKSVSMTGWRFGYFASPFDELSDAVRKLQSQSTSNINSITQKASITGLSKDLDADIEVMLKAFRERRDLAVEQLNSIPNISVIKPAGAFYLFVNVSKVEKDSIEFSKKLLENKGVAVVPGIGFGMDGYVRMSFATDLETIKKGIKRIEEFVSSYS